LALRSTINMQILAALREHKIEIPYPQRVMHMVGAPASKG
jgi:small-conductance mechanosensitive channel